MSFRKELQLINCNTLADVVAKYTSDAAQRLYSYMLCEVTMDATHFDYADADYSIVEPKASHLATVNLAIKKDMDTDIIRILQKLHNECSAYLIDMTQKGILQTLPVNILKRIRCMLDGFSDIYDRCLESMPRKFIQNIADHDENGDECGQINHFDKLFLISHADVQDYVMQFQSTTDKLNHYMHRLISSSLLDVLIDAKSAEEPVRQPAMPTKKKSNKKKPRGNL